MPPITIPATTVFDHLEPAGPPRTTPAGRFALPVNLMDGRYKVDSSELVFDEARATELLEALQLHLAGRAVGPCASPAAAQ
jgi:hypothetical protein